MNEVFPTLRELANQPALWILFALAASVYFWSRTKERRQKLARMKREADLVQTESEMKRINWIDLKRL